MVIFLTADWGEIGYKSLHPPKHVTIANLTEAVANITGISESVLHGEVSLTKCSAAQRLSWMGLRKTTRIEDLAYCLFGLFELNMTLLYGEGVRAIERLQIEILNRTGDESILACNTALRLLNFVPSSIANFRYGQQIKRASTHDRPPITVSARWAELRQTNRRSGVFKHREKDDLYVVRLNCAHFDRLLPPSPCIVFLHEAACGHLMTRSTEAWIQGTYINSAYHDMPACERDLIDVDQWTPVLSTTVRLIHLNEADTHTCSGSPQARALSDTVKFQLKDGV